MKVWSVLVVFAAVLVEATATGEDLPGPCREWLQPCLSGRWVCTSEYVYQQSRHGFQLGCPVQADTPTPPPGVECRVVNGTCQYTDSDLECTTWVPDCHFSYTCGSVQERERTANQSHCGGGQTPPLPDMQCLPINNTCQWYDPCYYWRGFCGGSYSCGNANQYYDFVFGPQPLCARPPEGWGEVLPPGECVVQDQQCQWSNCTAYLDFCRTSWTCASQYDKAVYFAGPPPPCPPPPPGYTPPPQPGVCKFNLVEDQCKFEALPTATPTPGTCPTGTHPSGRGTLCLPTCANYRGADICLLSECVCPEGLYFDDGTDRGCVQPAECFRVIEEDPCVLGLLICPSNEECIPDSSHPDGAYCSGSLTDTTVPYDDTCGLVVRCPDGYQCVLDSAHPEGAVCLTRNDVAPYSGPCEELSGTHRRGPNPRTLCLLTCSNYLGSDTCTPSECDCPQGTYFDDRFGGGCVPPDRCYRALGVAAIAGISVGIGLSVFMVLVVTLGLVLLTCCRKRGHVKASTASKVIQSNDASKEAENCKYSELKCEDSVSESSLEKDAGYVPKYPE